MQIKIDLGINNKWLRYLKYLKIDRIITYLNEYFTKNTRF